MTLPTLPTAYAHVSATFGPYRNVQAAQLCGLAWAQSLGLFLFDANPAGWGAVLVGVGDHEVLERAAQLATHARACGADLVEVRGARTFSGLMGFEVLRQ